MPHSSTSSLICTQALFSNQYPCALEAPLRLSRISRTSGIGLPGQDHALELVDSLGGMPPL